MDEGSVQVTRRPAPFLRPFIDSYVGYQMLGLPAGIHRGLPSRHLTFIVSIGEGIDVVAQTDPRQAPGRYEFVIGGLQARPALIASNGTQEGVAVELTPLGCRALLGLPARALWDTSVEAADVIGTPAVELRERLLETIGWDERFAACDEVLSRMAAEPRLVARELTGAWRMIVRSGGTIPISHVATQVGWGRRNLAERFAAEYGLSPKLAARVVRFDRARWMLMGHGRPAWPERDGRPAWPERDGRPAWPERDGRPAWPERSGRPALAEVAAECGYYDQSHLNRDFVDLAGCPPGEWLAVELPSVQDEIARHPSGSAA